MKLVHVCVIVTLGLMLTACHWRGPPGEKGEQGPKGDPGHSVAGPIIGVVSYDLDDSGGIPYCKAFGVAKCSLPTVKCLAGKKVNVQLSLTKHGTYALFCLQENFREIP